MEAAMVMAMEKQRQKEQIKRDWNNFSRTDGFKEFMKYLKMQHDFALGEANGSINTFLASDSPETQFDPSKSIYLLQRTVAYDIIKSYVDGYVESTTL